MPSYPAEIYKEDLSARWNNTKKLARKKAEDIDKAGKDAAKTQVKAFDNLDKKSFNQSFASNLAKWPTLYPDYKKMKELLDSKISKALKDYASATAADKTLSADVKLILNSQFTFITNSLKTYDTAAKALVDADLAKQQASGKIPPPIVVLKHPDILKLAVAEAGGLKNIDSVGTCPLEIVINDKEILAKFPNDKEYANQAQKIKDAANFSKLVSDIAKAIKEADTNVGANKPLDGEKKALEAKIEKAIDECAERATEEAGRQGKLKGNARWANIKSGLKLTLTTLGVVGGATAIALTPFTLGVSSIAGCIALGKSVVELGKQVYTLGAEVETLAARVGDNVKSMKKGYDKWLSDPAVQAAGGTSNKIGFAEFGKRGLNAVAPTWVTTIKSVKEGVEACDQKVNNIEVKANDMSLKLTKLLQEQTKAEKAFKEVQKLGRDALDDKEFANLLKILTIVDKSEKATDEVINKVTALNKRVADNRTVVHALEKQINAIDSKNPIWSDVASALFETTASVGYMFLGSTGAPEPYEFAKEAAEINEKVHKVVEVLEISLNAGEGLRDAVKKRSKQ